MFRVAERLGGRTVDEWMEVMTIPELYEWMGIISEEAAPNA